MVPIHAKKRKWVNSRALPDLAGSATWRLYTEQPWMSYRAPSLDENDSFRPRPPVGCVVAVALRVECRRLRPNLRSLAGHGPDCQSDERAEVSDEHELVAGREMDCVCHARPGGDQTVRRDADQARRRRLGQARQGHSKAPISRRWRGL